MRSICKGSSANRCRLYRACIMSATLSRGQQLLAAYNEGLIETYAQIVGRWQRPS
jgi:hypothetical protein